MKYTFIFLFTFMTISVFGQVKVNDDKKIVEVQTYEVEISTAQIDARIDGLKQSIESFQKEMLRLQALRKELEILEGKQMKAQAKKKK